MGDDVFGDRTLIEAIAPFLGDPPQRLRQCRIAHYLAGFGYASILEVMEPCAFITSKIGFILRPVGGDPWRRRHAFLGKTDGGLERLLEIHRAMPRQKGGPGIDGAWHRDRMHAFRIDGGEARGLEPFGIGLGRSAARAIDALYRAIVLSDEREAVALEPTPVICGSVMHRTAEAVTAASIELPPLRKTSRAEIVASGEDVAAMP